MSNPVIFLLSLPTSTTFLNYCIQVVKKDNMWFCWHLQTEVHHYQAADRFQNRPFHSCPPPNWMQSFRDYVCVCVFPVFFLRLSETVRGNVLI